MGKGLTKFSIESYITDRIKHDTQLEVLAEVQDDGDYYVLNPYPCESASVYRIPKTDVEIGPEAPPELCEDGKKKTMHLVRVEESAPCVRLTASTAGRILRPGISELTEAAVDLTTLRASIAFTSNGEGHLSFGGRTVKWLGNPSIEYTKDLTVRGVIGTDKFRRKYSNEFDVWMDYTVLIMGQRGIYIHEGAATLADNGGPSAGCVHVASPDAESFYNWVSQRTRITISYPWG